MSTRSNNKILVGIIIFLLITNIAVLAFFFTRNKPPRRWDKNKDMFATSLQKEVGFNDAQLAQFKALKQVHWADAKNRMDEIRQIKMRMYRLVQQPQPVSDSTLGQMADSIAQLQKLVEINAFRHFKQTRNICTPAQIPAFDSLMVKIISRPLRGKKPSR